MKKLTTIVMALSVMVLSGCGTINGMASGAVDGFQKDKEMFFSSKDDHEQAVNAGLTVISSHAFEGYQSSKLFASEKIVYDTCGVPYAGTMRYSYLQQLKSLIPQQYLACKSQVTSYLSNQFIMNGKKVVDNRLKEGGDDYLSAQAYLKAMAAKDAENSK